MTAFDLATPADITPYMGAHPNLAFESPSSNINCLIVNEFGANDVTCTIGQYDFDQPGPDCPDGAMVGINDNGTPQYQGCSTVPSSEEQATVLPYHYSLTNGRLGCLSAATGVTCLDLDTGKGFTLSRESMRLVSGPTSDSPSASCPVASTVVAAWDDAHEPTKATGASEIACAGTWAVAATTAGGNAVTGVFRSVAGSWTWVDRSAPCNDRAVPDAIYQEACNSN